MGGIGCLHTQYLPISLVDFIQNMSTNADFGVIQI